MVKLQSLHGWPLPAVHTLPSTSLQQCQRPPPGATLSPPVLLSIRERPRSHPDSSHPHHPTYVWSRHPLGPSRGAPTSPSGKWGYKTPPHRADTRTSFGRIININHFLQSQHLPCKGLVHLSPQQPSQQVQVTTDCLLPRLSASALDPHDLSQNPSFLKNPPKGFPTSRARAEVIIGYELERGGPLAEVGSRMHPSSSPSVFPEQQQQHLGTC